jgi:hypothetical protein
VSEANSGDYATASSMSLHVSTGYSSCARWPAFGIATTRAFCNSFAMARASRGGTQPSFAPTSNVTRLATVGSVRSNALKSHPANIVMTALACDSDCANVRYNDICSALMVDPVERIKPSKAKSLSASFAVSAAANPLRARNCTAGLSNDNAKLGGESAALMPTMLADGQRVASQSAIAPPAECPTIPNGSTCNSLTSVTSNSAIPGSVMRLAGAAVVKPWPGRSGAITVKCWASTGATSRHECVAPPEPCNNSSAGPWPMICTCQDSPLDVTNWLAPAFGQRARSDSQVVFVVREFITRRKIAVAGRRSAGASAVNVVHAARRVAEGSRARRYQEVSQWLREVA